MARLAVLASGNGSNFQALAEKLGSGEGRRHQCALLIYDRRAAFAADRAARLGIPARYVSYYKRDALEAEAEIASALSESGIDLVALAGFMRILSPAIVDSRRGRIANIHPSLLPKWPGARAIERAFEAGEREFGATVHLVDEGMDTGPILASSSFRSEPHCALSDIEARVHEIEHDIYPRAVVDLLDAIEDERGAR